MARLMQTDPFGVGNCIRDQVATRSNDHSESPPLCWFKGISDPALLSTRPYWLLYRKRGFETSIRHALPPREMEPLTWVSFTQLKGAEGTLANDGTAICANRSRRPNQTLCRSLRPNERFTYGTRPLVFPRTDLLQPTERPNTPTSKQMLPLAVSNVLTHLCRVRRGSTMSGGYKRRPLLASAEHCTWSWTNQRKLEPVARLHK